MKKVLAVLIMFVLLISFTGCNKSTNSTETPVQEKTVEISSDPEGATVFINGKEIKGTTPVTYNLKPGTYKIRIAKYFNPDSEFVFIYEGTIDVTNDKKEQTISVMLEKRVLYSEPICFDDRPEIDLRGPNIAGFAGIYLNETVRVSGITPLESFDLIFPSGKKIHFNTEKANIKYDDGKYVRKFSKMVTFNEMGEYKILAGGRVVTPGTGGYREYKFKVLYKAKILNMPTLGDLNGITADKRTIIVPIGKTIHLKLLMEDAKGNIARNKPIGLNNLKTDKNGIVTIEVKSTQYGVTPFVIYNDILGYDACFTTFDKSGNLIDARFVEVNQKGQLVYTLPDYIPRKTAVQIENGHIFMPFDCSGLSLYDLGFEPTASNIVINPKNPAVIYTNSLFSKDSGKTFQKFPDNLSFKVFADDPNNPDVIYGGQSDGALLKSTDCTHFTEIAHFKALTHITVDPKNSNKLYVTTNNKLLISKDGGKTWQTFLDWPAAPWINPQNTNIIFVKNKRTMDGGKTWEDINVYKKNPAEWNVPLQFAFDPNNPDVVYAVTHSHLFKSEDNGKTWAFTTMRYFNFINNIAIDPSNPKKIYIADRDGILESDSGGKGFKRISMDAPTPNAQFTFLVRTDTLGNVYALFCGVPFKMTNNKWTLLNTVFLKGTPKWKVINGTLFVDIKTIKSHTAAMQIDSGKVTFYRLFDETP